MRFPDTASALVDVLDKMYPEVLPKVGDDLVEIHRQTAKRELVVFLKRWRSKPVSDD